MKGVKLSTQKIQTVVEQPEEEQDSLPPYQSGESDITRPDDKCSIMYNGKSIPKTKHDCFVYFTGLSTKYPQHIKKMNEKKRLIKHHTFILKQLKKEYKESVDEFYKNLLDDPDNSEPELSELEDHDLVIPAKSQKKKD